MMIINSYSFLYVSSNNNKLLKLNKIEWNEMKLDKNKNLWWTIINILVTNLRIGTWVC